MRDKAANEKREESARFELWMDATRSSWRAWSKNEPAACSPASVGELMQEAFEAGFNTAAALRSREQQAVPVKLLESAANMMEYGRGIATDDDAASKFEYFRDQLRFAASPDARSEKKEK